jgi:hypothetical protein
VDGCFELPRGFPEFPKTSQVKNALSPQSPAAARVPVAARDRVGNSQVQSRRGHLACAERGLAMIAYQPPSPLPPPTQTLSAVAQVLIGAALGFVSLVGMVVMGALGADLHGLWWVAVFVYIWVLVFIAIRKRWYAMIFTAMLISAVGAVLGRVLVHVSGAAG